MAFEFTGLSKYLMRAAAIAVVGIGASGCSVMPDWMGGGGSTPAVTADDQADQQAAANTASPDLNSVPDRPAASSSADDQKVLTDSLGADRSQNQYSGNALRGGTEAAAAPPGAAPPDQVASTAQPSQPSAPPPAAPADAPAPDSGAIDAAAAANTSTADQAPPAPVPPAPAATADNSAPPAVAPNSQTAMNNEPAVPSSGPAPAVPAASYGTYGMSNSMVSPSDAALGFKPSMAPPLSASVAQFVPQPIIARYQQTAAMSRSAYSVSSESAYSATPVSNKAMGGPEHMSGAVVANFDSIQPDAAPMSTYMGGGTPSAVVAFAGDRTILDPQAKGQVRAAAAAFIQGGGQGYIRVVGHSSSGGDLSSQRHLVLNFEHSQARATAVARELIKDGVPAEKVLVQTSGDENAGASAEIFLQS